MLIVGTLVDRWLLVALCIMFLSWSAVQLSTVQFHSLEKSRRPIYDMAIQERVLLFFGCSQLLLFLLGLLKVTYLVSICVGVVVIMHALARPTAIESLRHRPQKVVASDGFVDDEDKDNEDEVEVLLFSKDTKKNGTNDESILTSPYINPSTIKKRRRTHLDIPIADNENESANVKSSTS